MIKLNDTSIIVGQIKQLLKDFNLPNCALGSDYATENNHFIKNNGIYRWYKVTDSNDVEKFEYEKVGDYVFGKKYQNLTSNLRISNSIYDRYTHRYLGKYLRFLKDYKGIDLMSMYNCFDQEVISKDIIAKTLDGVISNSFLVNDSSSICYSIPISGKAVTIYTIDSVKITACITLDMNNTSVNDTLAFLAAVSSQDINSDRPVLYDKLAKFAEMYTGTEAIVDYSFVDQCIIDTDSISKSIASILDLVNKNINNLRLILKVPKTYDKSIIVLDGDYTNIVNKNSSWIGYVPQNSLTEETDFGKIAETPYPYNPQLFSHENDEGNYLLSDRLIEYLTSNAITDMSETYDIEKLQRYLISNRLVKSDYLGIMSKEDIQALKRIASDKKLFWDKNDIIGYFDKDIEKETNGGII